MSTRSFNATRALARAFPFLILGLATCATLSARPGHCDSDGRLHPYYGDSVKNGVNFFKDLGPCDQRGKDVVIKLARPIQGFNGLLEGSSGGTVRLVGSDGKVLAESPVDVRGGFSFPASVVDSLAGPPVLCYAAGGQRQRCSMPGKLVIGGAGAGSLRVIPALTKPASSTVRRPQDCHPPNLWNGFACIELDDLRNPRIPAAN